MLEWLFTFAIAYTELILLSALTVYLATGYVDFRKISIPTLAYVPLLLLLRRVCPLGIHTITTIVVFPALIAMRLHIPYKRLARWFVVALSILLIAEVGTFLYLHRVVIPIPNVIGWQRLFVAAVPQSILLSILLLLTYNTRRRRMKTYIALQRQQRKDD